MNPTPELTEADLSKIRVDRGRFENRILYLRFNDKGAARLARATASNLGKRLVFIVDGRVVTAPIIQSRITGGDAVLESAFKDQEAERLAKVLSGS
jgi:preprotein translocase subunit SecD